ncbi:MAG: tRNA (adenosine(37)-N6)-dimethylallyltransferase MiaA [Lachnospiraceae bacterium]|nr:tRNA (adenosine(37)-N6)-dimethylallyltransferase MiaA [Lachnospiraceae bacterium]
MYKEKPALIILTGPTSVGKTELSIRLAKEINGEIISADSMQVYKGMDIGTAKITEEEKQGVPHHLLDCFEPDETFNVSVFQKMAQKAIEEIHARGAVPILTGGTAFYIQALLYGIDFTEENHDDSYRNSLYELGETEEGKIELYKRLKNYDPEYAQTVHYNNLKRVVRALEYRHYTGRNFSEYNELQRKRKAQYRFCYFVLNDDRAHLYDRINRRVDIMMKDGLESEVHALLEKGYTPDLVSMQGVGYKEMLAYFDGKESLADAIDTIKKNTRHFAKRQLTWFRKEEDVIWINKQDFDYDNSKILDYIYSYTKAIGIEKE